MNGAERIAAERQRQIEVEGYDPLHDLYDHDASELERAALTYLSNDPDKWPWSNYPKFGPDRVRELEKAGALIAAAIDHHLRLAATPSPDESASLEPHEHDFRMTTDFDGEPIRCIHCGATPPTSQPEASSVSDGAAHLRYEPHGWFDPVTGDGYAPDQPHALHDGCYWAGFEEGKREASEARAASASPAALDHASERCPNRWRCSLGLGWPGYDTAKQRQADIAAHFWVGCRRITKAEADAIRAAAYAEAEREASDA